MCPGAEKSAIHRESVKASSSSSARRPAHQNVASPIEIGHRRANAWYFLDEIAGMHARG